MENPENKEAPSILSINLPIREDIDFLSKKQEIITSTCEEQREAFKKTLEENLKNGINIKNQDDFDLFKELLKKYEVVSSLGDISFHSINQGAGIAIKKVGYILKVYNSHHISSIQIGRNPLGSDLAELGEIKNEKFIKTNWFASTVFREKDSNKDNTDITDIFPKDIECVAIEKPKEIHISTSEPKEMKEKTPETHTPHTIKRGEGLWKIVREKYDLTGSNDPERDIGNIIEKIKKDPKNSGVIKDSDTGKIFIGDILHLPKTVIFKYGGGEEKKYALK